MSDQSMPMVNANGEAYDIPLAQMPSALRSGLQLAVDMKHAGTGERYTIPQGRYKEALSNGMVPDSKMPGPPVLSGLSGDSPVMAPTLGSTPSEILSTIGQHAKNMVTAPYHAMVDDPRNAQEQAVMADAPGGSRILGRIGLTGDRLLGASNSVMSATDAVNQIRQGRYNDAAQSAEDAVPIVGPWAKQIETDVANKGAVAGLAGLATDVAPAALGEGVSALRNRVSAAPTKAYAGLLSRGSGLGKNFDPFNVATRSIEDVRNAATANPDVAAQVANGSPSEYTQGINSLINRAIDPLEKLHGNLRAPHSTAAPFSPGTTSTAIQALDDLKGKYPSSAAPERQFITDLQQKIAQTPDLEDLNNQRKMYGDYASRSYDQTSVQRGESPDAAKAYRAAADGLRQDYYNRLQTLTGVDLRPIMQRESALMDAKQAFASQGSGLLQAQAKATEPTPIVRDLYAHVRKEGVIKGLTGMAGERIFGQDPVAQPQHLARTMLSNGSSTGSSVRRFLTTLPGPIAADVSQ